MLKRKITKLYCCEKCQNYWTCEKKWYRGEKGQESVCCELCQFYKQHWKNVPKEPPSRKKTLKQVLQKKLLPKKK